jgi:polar amino acid transport system substrate-binding protein
MHAIRGLITALIALFLAVGPCPAKSAKPQVALTLAPTGKLRVGLYAGPTNIIRGANNEPRGVGFDLGKALAGRLGIPFVPVPYASPGDLMQGLKAGEWDICFVGVTAQRQEVLSFTAPFLVIEQSYLVPPGSSLASVTDVDRAGIRIGALQGGSVNAALSRTIKNATIVPIAGLTAAGDMLKAGKIDLFAANKANLSEISNNVPGSHILDGSIGVDEIPLGIPKGRETALPYLEQFLKDAKSNGLIRAVVRKAEVRGALEK